VSLDVLCLSTPLDIRYNNYPVVKPTQVVTLYPNGGACFPARIPFVVQN